MYCVDQAVGLIYIHVYSCYDIATQRNISASCISFYSTVVDGRRRYRTTELDIMIRHLHSDPAELFFIRQEPETRLIEDGVSLTPPLTLHPYACSTRFKRMEKMTRVRWPSERQPWVPLTECTLGRPMFSRDNIFDLMEQQAVDPTTLGVHLSSSRLLMKHCYPRLPTAQACMD